jgi:hypothetical protein
VQVKGGFHSTTAGFELISRLLVGSDADRLLSLLIQRQADMQES